jgi:hypothetical protein
MEKFVPRFLQIIPQIEEFLAPRKREIEQLPDPS